MTNALTAEELKETLLKHSLWIEDKEGGTRANLYGANLTRANLYGANLYGANLTRANLDGANLTRANLDGANLTRANLDGANLYGANLDGANLTRANLTRANLDGANLTRANLDGANLTRANLDGAKEDFLFKLSIVPGEVSGLYKSIWDGKIDGSVYTGECACFVGTIANIRKVSHRDVPGLTPNSASPTERLFLAIKKGDNPENNQVSAIVAGWCAEFMTENEILIPQREVIWTSYEA